MKINDSKIDMESLSPFLIWLLCVAISALILGFYIKQDTFLTKEGFFNSPIRITTCPLGTITYINSNGDTNCCDGDISGKRCNGTIACSLSPNPPGDLLSCPDWIRKEWRARSAKFCSKSMPYYFGSMDRLHDSLEGCSASPNIPDGSKPRDALLPRCKIYSKSKDDYGKADSCFNIKALDEMESPTPSATKNIIPITRYNNIEVPALFTSTYIPPNGSSMTPQTCYDWKRAKIFLDAIDTSGKFTEMYEKVKDKHVLFCGASKAYYVNGTLSKKDAIGV